MRVRDVLLTLSSIIAIDNENMLRNNTCSRDPRHSDEAVSDGC